MSSPGGFIRLSMSSGVFATLGSLVGKIASDSALDTPASFLVGALLLVLMVACNTIGCAFFVKSLSLSSSALPSTVASAATCYVCSGLVGFLIFGESTSIRWWGGILTMLVGLLLIASEKPKKD